MLLTISFGLPIEPEDSQYGKSRLIGPEEISGYLAGEVSEMRRLLDV